MRLEGTFKWKVTKKQKGITIKYKNLINSLKFSVAKTILSSYSIPSRKHLLEERVNKNLPKEGQLNFVFVKKCEREFDCLVYEILFTKELKPSLITSSDPISAKVLIRFQQIFVTYLFNKPLFSLYTIFTHATFWATCCFSPENIAIIAGINE